MKLNEKIEQRKIKIKMLFAVGMIIFLIFVFPMLWLVGIWGGIPVLSDFNSEQLNLIKSVYNINMPEEAKIVCIKKVSILNEHSFVLIIDNVVNTDKFIEDNNRITYVKYIGNFDIRFPNGLHASHGPDVSCYYFGDRVYLSVSDNSLYYGDKIKDLFYEIKNMGCRVSSDNTALYILIFCVVIIITLFIKNGKCIREQKSI